MILLRLRGKTSGAEYEKLEAQMSPTAAKGGGGAGANSSAAAAAKAGSSNGGGGGAEADPDDADFADWNEDAATGSVSIMIQSPSAAPTAGSSSARHGKSSSLSHSQQQQEEAPPPPPEPDYFASLSMGIPSAASAAHVTRVAAKKPLASQLQQGLHNPSNNLYANSALANGNSSTSNAHSTRFTEQLLEDGPVISSSGRGGSNSGGGGGWGNDDLGSLGLEDVAPSAGAAFSKSKKSPAAPREKKPRGIGAVAVALDSEA